jgi:hypothetical protein
MEHQGDGTDHQKWKQISHDISAKMGLTTPMTPNQIKDQVNSYVVSISIPD